MSQQLAMLEREAGVPLLERAGRGVRLTDAALVLTEHAAALLERAALAEADLAAAAGAVSGRAHVAAFQSVALRVAIPAMAALAASAPRLRAELVEAEPEPALPALARGNLDLVLGDEWQHQPWQLLRVAGLRITVASWCERLAHVVKTARALTWHRAIAGDEVEERWTRAPVDPCARGVHGLARRPVAVRAVLGPATRAACSARWRRPA